MAYRRSSGVTQREAVAAVAAGVVLAALAGTHAHASAHHPAHSTRETAAARAAIGYARHQFGCPYVYGATGPCSSGFDCSGLVMEAWASAGRSIPRTSEEQWAGLRHVPASQRKAGDLVFAPGSPIDPPPGHVGILLGRNTVEQAYATGYPINVVSLSSFGSGAGGITGFARP